MDLIHCTKCSKEISGQASTCPSCGSPVGSTPAVVPELKASAGSQVISIEPSLPINGGVVAIILILGGLLFLKMIASQGPDESQTSAVTSGSAASASHVEATPQPVEYTKVGFKEIREKMYGLTEAQFDKFRDTVLQKRVFWKGWVDEVHPASKGECEVLIDMDSPDETFSASDVKVSLPEEQAIKLKKHQRVEFYGNIVSITNFMGCNVELSDVLLK